MPGSFLASVVDGATAGRRVVAGLALEAATVAVVAGGASVVAVVRFGLAASVVVAAGTTVVVVALEAAVAASLDATAPGDGLGEHAAVTTTAVARTSDRASTTRTYAAAP
jgi:hypothetical protein